MCKNLNVLFTLLPPHFGSFDHSAEDRQVKESDPTTSYPMSHAKVAIVLTGYPWFTPGLLYHTWPCVTFRDGQFASNKKMLIFYVII